MSAQADRGDMVSDQVAKMSTGDAAKFATASEQEEAVRTRNQMTGEDDSDDEQQSHETSSEEAEVQEEEAQEGAPERDEKGRFIPKPRFDEAVKKERTRAESAERQLAELQNQLRQASSEAQTEDIEQEIVNLEEAYTGAIIDGDKERAAVLAQQIRLKERQIQLQTADTMTSQARQQAEENIRVDMAIQALEQAYPVLDEKSDQFDQDLTDLVLASQRNLIDNERMTPSQALLEGAKKVMAKFAAAQGAPAKGGLGAAKSNGDDRKQHQVNRNIDTAKKQPASMKNVGMDSNAAGIQGDIDVAQLSAEEFAQLPAATRSRLRGDML